MWKAKDWSTRLGMSVPIVQGPFGGGLSSVGLTATVSDNGGLGSFGAHHLSGEQLLATAAQLRRRTARPFALNLWIPHQGSDTAHIDDAQFERQVQRLRPYYDALGLSPPRRPSTFWPAYDEQLAAVLDARPAVFSFVFGAPPPTVLETCRRRGIFTIGTATSVREALHLEQAGVDAVVASGFEAGGHRPSFLQEPECCLTGTLALIPQVVDAVKRPVIAAGGIADGRGVAAALALGAQGVQIGTAFLACRQSNASPAHREALFGDDAGHTALTRAFTGRLARGIVNRFMREQAMHADDLPPYPVQNWFTAPIKAAAAAQDRPEFLPLWAGQAAPLLRSRDAGEFMQGLIADLDRRLG